MLNKIWGLMIIIGVAYGAVTGKMEAVTAAALDSAKEAVSLCITMIGVMSLWVGLMEIARDAGIIAALNRKLNPFLSWLFPDIPKDHPAREHISTNIVANLLGLGWACTPAGLKAMEALAKLEEERGNPAYLGESGGVKDGGKADRIRQSGGSSVAAAPEGRSRGQNGDGKMERVASKEMCTFLILNISSLQLIPVNMIAYRSQYGSVNPAGIIAPAIVATAASTAAAVVYCKIRGRKCN
ncbi:MAG: nucleoside recognition protein [Clostridium sp.]|nr:nucleoside recognition protein [Clostridium sp.]